MLVCVPEITLLREELLESQPVSASPRPGAHWALQNLMLLQFRVHYLHMWSAQRDMSWADSLTCLGTHQPLMGAFICYWMRSELLPLCRVGHCQHSEKAHLEMLMRVQNHRMVINKKCKFLHVGQNSPYISTAWDWMAEEQFFRKGLVDSTQVGCEPSVCPCSKLDNYILCSIPESASTMSREEIFPFNQQVGDCTWSTLASYGSFYKSKSNIAELEQIQVRLLRRSGGWSAWHTKKGWSNWVCVARRREGKSSF